MTSRLIETEYDRLSLGKFIAGKKLPFVVTLTDGRKRSVEQNRLQFLWANEIAEQQEGLTPEYVRAMNKLEIGIPIRRAACEKYRKAYDEMIRPYIYEKKIELIMALDFAVTRDMTVSQLSEFLDGVNRFWTEQGVRLTEPL